MRFDICVKILAFLACFSYVTYQCVRCLKKYMDFPKGIDLSMGHGIGELFPQFTFCTNINLSVLHSCGIKPYGYRKDGKWHVEKGPEYCQNPKSLVEGLRIQRESIITKIRMQDASKTDIPQIGHWSFFDDQNSGNCHVFTISPENHSIPIRQLTFYLANDIPQTKVYIDSPGSFQSGDNIFLKQCSEVFSMDYENCKMLDHMGRECDNDINYNKDNCYRDKIFQTSMKKLNCTWPFLNDKNHICTHRDIAKEATKIGQTIRKSVKCKSSCNYLKASMSFLKSYCAKNGPQHLRFLFKEHRKVFKAYYTYTELSLIAEIGGYVGLFLGWSIYQITDVPHYFIKLKQRLF